MSIGLMKSSTFQRSPTRLLLLLSPPPPPHPQAQQDAESFAWIMDNFNHMRGADAPPIRTAFTDQDPAIAAALKQNLPDVLHLLCVWHILGKNLATNMKGYFSSKCQLYQHVGNMVVKYQVLGCMYAGFLVVPYR